MFKEFKEFVQRGNVVDLAVAVIIGGAFGKIITSLVDDIIVPLIGLAMGGKDLNNYFVSLDGSSYETLEAAKEAGAATLNHGSFIQHIIDFIIIAFVIFLMVRSINKAKRKKEEGLPTTKACDYCKTDIPVEASRCPHCTSELKV